MHVASRKRRSPVIVVCAALALAMFAAPAAYGEGFTRTGDLNVPRAHTTNVKLADGRVLVAGGETTGGETVTSAEIYDPVTGTFSLVPGAMTVKRLLARGILLADGRVLIAGGQDGGTGTHGPRDDAELFDPRTGTFTAVADLMSNDRVWPLMVMLGNGKVLVSHGCCGGANTADLYDPATETFTATVGQPDGAFTNATGTATTLHDGRVLIAGDWAGRGAQIYNPVTDAFTTTAGQMTVMREVASAALLPNGTVLIAGADADGTQATAEIFDPVTGLFTSTANAMSAGRSQAYSATLPDGRVLIAGGASSWGGLPTSSADIYDPATGRFSPTTPMTTPRAQIGISDAIVLDDGCVLIPGGATQAAAADDAPTAAADLFCTSEDGADPTAPRIRIVAGRRTLVIRVRVDGPGRLVQRGVIRSSRWDRASASTAACRSARAVKRASTVSIGCRLTAQTRRRLRRGSLRLRVTVTFTPVTGSAQSLTRTVRLARVSTGSAVLG